MKAPKIKDYFKPTPKRLRILGDTLLGVSSVITAAAIAQQVNWLAYSSLIIGVIGKVFTNFFKDEVDSNDITH